MTQIIECDNAREVDRIVERNIHMIKDNERAKLSQFANNAKRRIHRIAQEKMKSYFDLLN